MNDKDFYEFFKFAIVSGDSEYVEIWDLHTKTELRVKKDGIPILMESLQILYESCRPE